MADDGTQNVDEALDPFEDPFIARRKYYLGSARIRLRHLCFDNEYRGGRILDRKNIARLRRVFDVEGCHRDDPEHHVPVVIDPGLLNLVRDEARVEKSALFDIQRPLPNLRLSSDIRLTCLHGQHRVEAAKEYLDASDRWWTVDFFDKNADPHVLVDLREEYSNARAFCDGDIFRHLRHYQQIGDNARAGRWLARLSKSKTRDVKQLIDKDRPLCTAFDRLLPFTGLWASFRIGTLHRILTLRCEDELIHYLDRIYDQWKFIMGPVAPELLDSQTVAFGQLLIPSISTKDRELIRAGPSGIFDQVDSEETRVELFGRLERAQWNTSGRILSLYTFTEDTKYIEPCAQIMRSIIPKLKRDDSVFRLFRKNWDGKERSTVPIQCGEDCTIDIPMMDDTFKVGYHQLWLFAMRYFPQMTRVNPRKDKGGETPESSICEVFWPIFAELATDLGFDTPEIQKLKNNDPTESILLNAVRSLRPLSQDGSFETSLKDEMRKLKESVKSWSRTTAGTVPLCSLKQESKDIALMQRCGRPFQEAYIKDRPLLFLHNVYLNNRFEGRYAASFAFKRDIFRCFFSFSEPARTHVLKFIAQFSRRQRASTNNVSLGSNTLASRGPQGGQPQAEPNGQGDSPPTGPEVGQQVGPWVAEAGNPSQTSKRRRESQDMVSPGLMDARMVPSPDRGDLPHVSSSGPFFVHSEQTDIEDIRGALLGRLPDRVIYLFRTRMFYCCTPDTMDAFRNIVDQLRNQQYSFAIVNEDASHLAYVQNPLEEDAKLFFAEPKGQPTGHGNHERQEQGSISDEIAREITCLMSHFYPHHEQNSSERQSKRRRINIHEILSHHPFNMESR
ncbi:hypothetical protein EV356DRAFT_537224 [Viridothelium virens]|uniref:Uncharacterized protein n=1 Tax=Viridothelium virens TaxID=1048519 RepID=A0A6A6GV30_VIRVR|nr:hypothetical protein EV356DRAFT_537224 [Viridothelium virens]